jgi:hypothetical protein
MALLPVCVLLAAPRPIVAASERPNVVFILADDKYLPSDQNDCVCRDFGGLLGYSATLWINADCGRFLAIGDN